MLTFILTYCEYVDLIEEITKLHKELNSIPKAYM